MAPLKNRPPLSSAAVGWGGAGDAGAHHVEAVEDGFGRLFCFVAKLRPFFVRRARGSCLIRRENRTKTFT